MTSADTLVCRDPSSGELLGELPQFGAAQIDEVVAAAREAQPRWGQVTWDARAAVFSDLLTGLVDSQPELLRVLAHDSGKAMSWGLLEELIPSAERLEYLASSAGPDARGIVAHGVVGLVMGHRTPLYDVLAIGATALAAGNAVVFKPDARSTWCTVEFAQRMRSALTAAGHSGALVDVVTGDEESERLLRAADLDVVGTTQPERTSPRARSWVVVSTEGPPPGDRMAALLAPLGAPRPCVFLVTPDHLDAWRSGLAEAMAALDDGTPTQDSAQVGVAAPKDAELARTAVAAAVSRGARRVGFEPRSLELLQIDDPLDPAVGQRLDAPLVVVSAIRGPDALGAAIRGLPHPVSAVVLTGSEDEGRTLGRTLSAEDLYLSPWGAWARPVFGPPASDHQVDLRRMGTSQSVTANALRDLVNSGLDVETLESLVRTRFGGGTLPRMQAAATLLRSWWSRK